MRSLMLALLLCASTALAETREERKAGQEAEKAAKQAEKELKAAISINKRAYGQGKYALDLDNVRCGWVSNVEGGHAVAEVVTERLGGDWLPKKHIGNVKWEAISFEVGPDTTNFLAEWEARATLDKPHAGVLTRFNEEGLPVERLEFVASITSIGLPAVNVDGRPADRAGVRVTLAPESGKVTFTPEGAPFLPPGPDYPRISGKRRGLVASVRASLYRSGEALTLVPRAVAPETILFSRSSAAVGESRDYEQEATSVEIPNLVLTLAESEGKPLYDWHEDFVIKGNSSDANEATLVLEYLRRDGEVLWTGTFANVGPAAMRFSLGDLKREPTVDATLYEEDALLSRGSVPPPDAADADDPADADSTTDTAPR